jgi:hypothetical protein
MLALPRLFRARPCKRRLKRGPTKMSKRHRRKRDPLARRERDRKKRDRYRRGGGEVKETEKGEE